MKNYYENQISKTMRENHNIKSQKYINKYDTKKIKNLKTEYKKDRINSKIFNELDYNYLHQTSSSLYKITKSKSSKKKIKNGNQNKKDILIVSHPKGKKVCELKLSNNINCNQIQTSSNSLLEKEKLDIIYQKNFYSENNINERKSQIPNNFYNYFPKPEPFPKTINYNFSINNNLKCKNDNSNSKDSTIRNSNSLNKREDNNILYLLMNLNLGDLYNIFMSNCISFNDIFLLTKEDFIEMKIPIGPRNRIIHFLSEYKKFGKTFDFKELSSFLSDYRKLMDKPILNDINFTESFFKIINNDKKKENLGRNFKGIKNQKELLLNVISNNSNSNLINNPKEKNINLHRLKKYNSVVGKKAEIKNIKNSQINNRLFNKNIKSKYSKEKSNVKKTSFSKNLSKYNSFKNENINNGFLTKRNNFVRLYQKFNDMNKKVNVFQQNYSKIQKYSKFIDDKISEFLTNRKIT